MRGDYKGILLDLSGFMDVYPPCTLESQRVGECVCCLYHTVNVNKRPAPTTTESITMLKQRNFYPANATGLAG